MKAAASAGGLASGSAGVAQVLPAQAPRQHGARNVADLGKTVSNKHRGKQLAATNAWPNILCDNLCIDTTCAGRHKQHDV